VLVIVVYDIADDDRRQSVFSTLQGVGTRVQLSTFECRFERTDEENILRETLRGMIDSEEDQIRFYYIETGADGPLVTTMGERTLEEWKGYYIL